MNAEDAFVLTPQITHVFSGARRFGWDFEGVVLRSSEIIMQGSFKDVLKSNGVVRDIYDIEGETSGKSLQFIFEKFKNDNNLKPSVDELLRQRKASYLDLKEKFHLGVTPFTAPIAKFTNDAHIENFIISNGDDSVIRDVLKEGGVDSYFSHIYASNSPERNAFEDKYGKEMKGNKAKFLAQYSINNQIPPKNFVVIEDNHEHLGKMQKEMRTAWKALLETEKFKPDPTLTVDNMGEIREIYVQHEFNLRHHFEPNTGVKLQAFAPKPLLDYLGMK